MPMADQVAIIYAGTQGYLDKIPVNQVHEFEQNFLQFMNDSHPELLEEIEKTGELKSVDKFGKVAGDFVESYLSGKKADVR